MPRIFFLKVADGFVFQHRLNNEIVDKQRFLHGVVAVFAMNDDNLNSR